MRGYVQLSGIIFGLVSLAHLLRLFRRWPLLVAGMPVPALASFVMLLGAGLMAYWAWRLLAAPVAPTASAGTPDGSTR